MRDVGRTVDERPGGRFDQLPTCPDRQLAFEDLKGLGLAPMHVKGRPGALRATLFDKRKPAASCLCTGLEGRQEVEEPVRVAIAVAETIWTYRGIGFSQVGSLSELVRSTVDRWPPRRHRPDGPPASCSRFAVPARGGPLNVGGLGPIQQSGAVPARAQRECSAAAMGAARLAGPQPSTWARSGRRPSTSTSTRLVAMSPTAC
jgi:hypothetical protein